MMTDPRRGQAHLAREAAARRTMFAAVLAAFVAIFGLIAVAGKAATTSQSAAVPAGDNRVIAEIPVANLDGDNRVTIVRIVAPDEQAAVPHARTRAS
jgi:hypothetical protein